MCQHKREGIYKNGEKRTEAQVVGREEGTKEG